MTLYDKFITDVESGKQLSNKLVKLAVARHVRDLKKSKRKRYKYYFDPQAADFAIRFVKLLRHTKGEWANRHFDLQPFQAFIIAMIFGWKRKENDLRRFSKSYVEIARKNGKSELAGAIGLFMLIMDDEEAAEVYTAATKREQAKIVFEISKSMARKLRRDSIAMHQLIGIHTSNIHVLETESKYETMPAEADKEDGKSPHCAIVDEYHSHKTSSLYKVIETGMGGRPQPLLFTITTAGFNRESPCFALRTVCANILNGTMQDDSFFTIIFTLDDGDDWTDKKMWIKSNPNIGNVPYWNYMDTKFTSALNEGEIAEIEFKTKNLNIWTSTASTWIKDSDWQACAASFTEEDLAGCEAVGGLDLSSVFDLTTFGLIFPPCEKFDKYRMIVYHFAPEDKIKNRKSLDNVNYWQWYRDGWINSTPGNVIDQDWIFDFIGKKCEKFNVKYVEVDRYNATQIIIKLNDVGIRAEKFGQGFASMSAPTKQFSILIMRKQIEHNGNPLMRWQMGNVEIARNPAGDVKIDKSNPKRKVDGPVAAVMALGGILTPEKEDEKYTGNGPVIL